MTDGNHPDTCLARQPGGRGNLLPQDGEQCKVKPPVIQKQAPIDDEEDGNEESGDVKVVEDRGCRAVRLDTSYLRLFPE